MYLFVWNTEWERGWERERKRRREKCPICWFTSQRLHSIVRDGPDQSPEPEAQKSIWISHVGGSGVSAWAILCSLPRHITGELDQQWAAGTQTRHSDRGCGHSKWQVNCWPNTYFCITLLCICYCVTNHPKISGLKQQLLILFVYDSVGQHFGLDLADYTATGL